MSSEKDDDGAISSAAKPREYCHSCLRACSQPLISLDHGGSWGQFSSVVQNLDSEDCKERYREEEADNRKQGANPPAARNSNDAPDKIIISWAENDEENPYNWPQVWSTTPLVLDFLETD